ncbi:MAG TPA: hypothetical protein VGO51_17230 [Burkholderiaceae bacterium]|nr:hypothetical protein [Burkholderiaceae bacterium]
MRADYFIGGVAFDALRAGIPVGNFSGWRQHVDCVVGDTLNKQPKALLALAQGFLRRFALSDIAGDFGKTN